MVISREIKDGQVEMAQAASAVEEFFAQNDYTAKRLLLIIPDNTRSGPIGEIFRMIFDAVADKAADTSYKPKGKAVRYVAMATMLTKKKRYNRALKSLKRALKEDPDYAEIFRLQAVIYDKKKMPDRALAATKRADELEAAYNGGGSPTPEDAPQAPVKPEVVPSTDATPAAPEGKGSALERATAMKQGA